ncbi:hypothetical protein [Scytonema sp. NUACC21]
MSKLICIELAPSLWEGVCGIALPTIAIRFLGFDFCNKVMVQDMSDAIVKASFVDCVVNNERRFDK